MKWVLTIAACVMVLTAPAGAIVINQLDDFQGGTVMGWTEGAPSPNPPIVNINGGPGGLGDHSLFNASTGSGLPGGAMVMHNTLQWTGDYTAAGVDTITGLMKASPNGSALLMRVAIQGAPGNWWASTNAIPLPNDDGWYNVSFGLNAAELTHLAGPDPLNVVMGNVTELRILSSTAPNWRGSRIPAFLDVDNVMAVPEPASLVLVTVGALALVRRRRRR